MRKPLYFWLISLIFFIGAAFSFYLAFVQPEQASGWVQVALVIIGLPIILYQLLEIRRNFEQKPLVDVGIASIEDYPIANVKRSKELKQKIVVKQGYPFFVLLFRNKGKITIHFLKAFLEFTGSSAKEFDPWSPKLIVNEFSEQKKSFLSENNSEFTYEGGADFCIYPGDTESFGFIFTTTIVSKGKDDNEIRHFPRDSKCKLRCTIWAEGLEEPIEKDLEVEILKSQNIHPETKYLFPNEL